MLFNLQILLFYFVKKGKLYVNLNITADKFISCL